MKNSLLIGVLCALACGLVGAPAPAQPLPAQNIAPKSGYELFGEARSLVQDGPNGEPLADVELDPAENLRLQRLGTARNAPALAKLREALKARVLFPEPDFAPDTIMKQFESNAAVRNFARQFTQEAAVRAADGDAFGAAQSSLDALELATQIAHGPIINALVGTATAMIARKSLLKIAPSLNAAQTREVAAQWEQIAGRMPSYSQTLRSEERGELSLLRRDFAQNAINLDDTQDGIAQIKTLAEMQLVGKNDWTEAELSAIKAALMQSPQITIADVENDLRVIFDQALARAAMPYVVAALAPPIRATTPPMLSKAQLLNAPLTRFYAERYLLDNCALVAALRLRAIKLETGAYPETLDTTVDPFSPNLAPLIYRRAGDSYILYSVGPDGKDDDGAEIQTLLTDDETGAKSVSERLMPDSTGDISVPVL